MGGFRRSAENMSYFVNLGDRLLHKLITYGILMHLYICVASIAGVLLVVVGITEMIEATKLATAVENEEIKIHGVDLINPTWSEAFEAVRGRTFLNEVLLLLGKVGLAGLGVWLSFWGYFFVKRGGPKRRKW